MVVDVFGCGDFVVGVYCWGIVGQWLVLCVNYFWFSDCWIVCGCGLWVV